MYVLGCEGEHARSRRVDAAVRVLNGRRTLSALTRGAWTDAEVELADDWLWIGYCSSRSIPPTAGEEKDERVMLPGNGAGDDDD